MCIRDRPCKEERDGAAEKDNCSEPDEKIWRLDVYKRQAALVIAGLAAEGYTVVEEIGYIQRGYENFEEKLRGLGARCV